MEGKRLDCVVHHVDFNSYMQVQGGAMLLDFREAEELIIIQACQGKAVFGWPLHSFSSFPVSWSSVHTLYVVFSTLCVCEQRARKKEGVRDESNNQIQGVILHR